MRVLFVTNTFTPHVGGVARSIEAFTRELRLQNAEVLTVAPTFEDMPDEEDGVLRVSAIQNFNGSDFSVAYPLTGVVRSAVEDFEPDVIHSHHPFLLGATAYCLAHETGTPLVFTHHTMYEQYTHYVPGDSQTMKRFAIELGTCYANMCDHVIAPSESIRDELSARGVNSPISVVPTGVQRERFREGSGSGLRAIMGIPIDAFVVGHVGRLALEKNLKFLGESVREFLQDHPEAHFLLVGTGTYASTLIASLEEAGLEQRIHWPGALSGRFLTSAYQAMDVFAFASHSETQGMVLTEAMAAGVPVVAVDAPGVREVLRNEMNGRCIAEDSVSEFCQALHAISTADGELQSALEQGAQDTAEEYSIQNSTRKLLKIYEGLLAGPHQQEGREQSMWERAMKMLEAEWDLLKGVAGAAGSAVFEDSSQ